MADEKPSGRTLRGKLTGAFIQSLEAQWAEHGDAVLDRLRTESPSRFAEIVSRLCPTETHISTGDNPYANCESREQLVDKMLAGIGAQRVSTEMRKRALEEITRHAESMRRIAGVAQVLPVIEREALRRIS